jgi:CRP-like cAMP-binding protein
MKPFSKSAKVKALKRAPLFQGLSQKELGELEKVTEDMDGEPGTVLIREGEIGKEFFVLLEGEVEVERKGKSLGTRDAGDFFGEIAVLEQVPRTATVTAKTHVRFLVLTRPAFRRLIADNPAVETKVLRALAKRVLTLSDDPSLC